MRWNEKSWEEMRWNEMRWDEMRRAEMRWEEMRWDEMKRWSVECGVWSVSAKCEVWTLQFDVWSFKWDLWSSASVSHKACTHRPCWRTALASSIDENKFYNISLRQLPPRLVRVLLVWISMDVISRRFAWMRTSRDKAGPISFGNPVWYGVRVSIRDLKFF